jgi:lipoprotein NlpD
VAEVGAGDPSFLHFEVRRGFEAVDPDRYLP